MLNKKFSEEYNLICNENDDEEEFEDDQEFEKRIGSDNKDDNEK